MVSLLQQKQPSVLSHLEKKIKFIIAYLFCNFSKCMFILIKWPVVRKSLHLILLMLTQHLVETLTLPFLHFCAFLFSSFLSFTQTCLHYLLFIVSFVFHVLSHPLFPCFIVLLCIFCAEVKEQSSSLPWAALLKTWVGRHFSQWWPSWWQPAQARKTGNCGSREGVELGLIRICWFSYWLSLCCTSMDWVQWKLEACGHKWQGCRHVVLHCCFCLEVRLAP